MGCQSKWNGTQNLISHKTECHTKKNATQNGVSPKIECHLNGISLKMEYQSQLNVNKK